MPTQRRKWPSRSRDGVRFQVLSDLHLEVGQQYTQFHIPATAPYLVLAGDIGNLRQYDLYLEFLQRQCAKFRIVFLVLGNHEFYHISREEGIALAVSLENEPVLHGKLKLLNRARVDLSGVVVLGCTLQSCISPDNRAVISSRVNDFKKILQWTVDDHNSEHLQDVNWIEQEIATVRKEDAAHGCRQRRILVITHHAPTRRGTSHPEKENGLLVEAFASDLLHNANSQSSLLDIHSWVFGHTHYTTCFQHGNTNLISNQRGYILPDRSIKKLAPAAIWSRLRCPSWWHPTKHHGNHTFDVRRTITV